MTLEKLPPHDLDAEEAVLGSILIDPDIVETLRLELDRADFYSSANQLIYKAMLKCEKANQIAVAHQLNADGHLELAGGVAYLSHLISICPTSLDAEYYAKIVKDCAARRKILLLAERGDFHAIQKVSSEMLSAGPHIVYPTEHGQAIIDMAQEIENKEPYKDSVYFGWKYLDEATTGMQPGDFYVIGGRPTHGKSQILLEVAHHNARVRKRVLFCSLEMSLKQMAEREVATDAMVDIRRLRRGELDDAEWQRVYDISGHVTEIPLFFICGQLPLAILREKCQRLLNDQGKVDLIIVDYLQLLPDCRDRRVGETTAARVGYASSSLKALATEFQVPVLCASQLNRAVEGREDKRPTLADLRESGNIEQDADGVLLLYRSELYDSKKEPGVLNIRVAKLRQFTPPTSPIKLLWLKKYHRYDDYSERPEEERKLV